VPVDETPATSEEIVPPVESTVPNEVIETDRIPSIETQVQGITDFPSTIILEDGTEESIDYNPSTTSIEIGENSYTITSIKKYGQELL
jgi:hypothetical protein